MRLLLVIDQFDAANNGTTISALRFAGALSERGHEVRVACTWKPGAPGEDVQPFRHYLFDPLRIPGFNGVIARQGAALAKPDDAKLREALEWADVTHFMLPFWLCRRGKRIADELGVPSTAAFHVQPQNITYSLGLGQWRFVNNALYAAFRPYFNRFEHLHIPSPYLAGELNSRGYRAQLHVISNGVDPQFVYRRDAKRPQWADRIVITTVGRHSKEKRHDLLIEAVRRSRHASQIQLVIAGYGPLTEKLEKLGASLPHRPVLGFFPQAQLRDLLAESDLYVHPADAEIEGISCIEAFASGLVPVISDSPASAAGQFALDSRSLFRAGDPSSLAKAIDDWIEDDAERNRMGQVYAEAGRAYGLEQSVDAFEAMLTTAMGVTRKTLPEAVLSVR